MASTEIAAPQTTVNPSEVGWQFVPQYYTFVNKQPNRLHCFYTKASTIIHGVEGEDEKPCYGQQEIHDKITSIGFQDCKVYIHSVDSQSSTNGGIIIQVIGEMSNRGEAWRKFVQTFFLAEQAGGYFVLNDIFRFLKEDAVEDDEYTGEAEPEASAPVAEAQEEPAVTAPIPEPSPAPASAPEPAEEPTVVEPEPPLPEPTAQVNGTHEPTPEPEPEQPERVPTPPVAAPVAEKPPTVPQSPAPQPPAEAPAAPQKTAPQAPPAQPTPPPAPVPAPAPTAPKTWANLAAANPKKWGTAVAHESRGTSEAPPSTQTPPPVTVRSQQPRPEAASNTTQNITTPQCFVKNVLETVSQAALTNTLTTRFGPVKDVEIIRNKACAFLEFATLEAAKRAITASLPADRGGEGGIRIDVDGGSVRILVETRKERGERPVSRPRGGGPNSEGRGGFRGRGQGRGRGGPKQ